MYAHLKDEGAISKGMIPKLDNAFAAMQNGVNKVVICHAADVDKIIGQDKPAIGTSLAI